MNSRHASHARSRPSVDVSVVVPLYNHARYLRSTIASALEQTVAIRELICIDDGSTDASFAIVSELAASHPEIRTWTRPNRGAHATLNEAIAASRGEFVAILNSDDEYEPERLARCLSVLRDDPSTDLVFTGVGFINADGKRISDRWYTEAIDFHRRSRDLQTSLARANFAMSTSNFVARRSLFDEIGSFCALRYAHDLEFLLRMLALDRRISVIETKLLRYRFHASNTISESGDAVRVELAAILAALVRRRVGSITRPPDAAELDRLLEAARVHDVRALVLRLLTEGPGEPSRLDPASILDSHDPSRLRSLLGH